MMQLFTNTEYDNNIFNENAEIDFFKIIYKRHTNFFINHMITENDNININQITTLNFIINNEGDLLSNSYINLTNENHYIELLKNNIKFKNSLTINILSFFDNYYITEYDKNMIKNIMIFKVKLQNYLTIQSTTQQSQLFINLIKTLSYITLVQKGIYYNINLPYYFYSFNYMFKECCFYVVLI